MDYIRAKEYILDKLENELDERLYYHNLNHTLEVLEAAVWIAKMENIDDQDLILLKTAALYHDTGYLFKYKGHERASMQIVRKILPEYGYKHSDIKKINEMILATEMPQNPKSHLAHILCDADLDYIGRNDFDENANKLLNEFLAFGVVKEKGNWDQIQMNFLENHKFYTKTSNLIREIIKQQNLRKVKEALSIELTVSRQRILLPITHSHRIQPYFKNDK